MKENSNTIIAVNSAILYGRLFIVTITSLFTTRFALQALGAVDYGLFSVLGSIIAFISILNTVMLSASNRFISVAIGQNDDDEVRKQFNICLLFHVLIALTTLLIAVPFGYLYVFHLMNFDGDLHIAFWVFIISILGAVISFIGVPYNGVLMAKERFIVFCSVDAIVHVIKMMAAFSLLYCFSNKLIVYTFVQGILTAIPTLIFYFVCKRYYPQYTNFLLCKDKSKYKDIFDFSKWIAFGAVATVGKSQGSALLINAFFNTTMNAALGLANTVNSLVVSFSSNISQPMAPQITKSYAAGNRKRCDELLVLSTKFTYLMTLCICLPFFINPNWIYSIWLGTVPDYVIQFTTLVIIDSLITALNSGISSLIFASGIIKSYQLSINTLRLLSILGAYIVLKVGFGGPALLYAYIVFSVIIFFTGQFILKKSLKYDNSILWRYSYLPSISITLLCLPVLLLSHLTIHPLIQIGVGETVLFTLTVLLAFSKQERSYLLSKVYEKKNLLHF